MNSTPREPRLRIYGMDPILPEMSRMKKTSMGHSCRVSRNLEEKHQLHTIKIDYKSETIKIFNIFKTIFLNNF